MPGVSFKIEQLREAVQDLIKADGRENEDLNLYRWLKSRNLDVKKAESMMRQSIKWRKDINIDALVEGDYHAELKVLFPVHEGQLRNGGPFSWLQVGQLDLAGLTAQYTKKVVHEYVMQYALKQEVHVYRWNQQRLMQCGINPKCEDFPAEIIQGTVIFMDLNRMSLKQLMSFDALTLAMQIIKDYLSYFPTIGSTVIAFNCSKTAFPFVNFLKKFAEKPNLTILLYDTDLKSWKDSILTRMDRKYLPAYMNSDTLQF